MSRDTFWVGNEWGFTCRSHFGSRLLIQPESAGSTHAESATVLNQPESPMQNRSSEVDFFHDLVAGAPGSDAWLLDKRKEMDRRREVTIQEVRKALQEVQALEEDGEAAAGLMTEKCKKPLPASWSGRPT